MPRWIALGAFLGLAALMLISGFAAVHMLEQMHLREDAIRHAFATRTRVFTDLVVSVQSCHGDLPRNASGEPDPSLPQLLDRMETQINTALFNYSGANYSAEQERLHRIAELVTQQKGLYTTYFAWTPAERQRQAPTMFVERIVPLQRRMTDWATQVQVWNTERIRDDDDAVVAELGTMQSELSRVLWVALGSGLLLIAASLGYMVRMERQARERVVQLSENSRELQSLSARVVDAQETERRSISRELHDEVGQSLGALLVDLSRMAANPPAGQPEVKDQLERMKSAAERTMQTVRNIALLLRPSMLDDLGLAAALEWQGREVSRTSQMEVEVHSDNVSTDLPDDYKICIYRIVQEALNNSVRHSGARNAKVTVDQTATKITARITDAGTGFDPARTRGMGLLGMDERVKRLNGKFSVDSQPGRGTTISVDLPLPTPGSPA